MTANSYNFIELPDRSYDLIEFSKLYYADRCGPREKVRDEKRFQEERKLREWHKKSKAKMATCSRGHLYVNTTRNLMMDDDTLCEICRNSQRFYGSAFKIIKLGKNTIKLRCHCNYHNDYTITIPRNYNDCYEKKIICTICQQSKNNKNYNFDNIKKHFTEHKYVLLNPSVSLSSINQRTLLKTICPQGHCYDVTFDDFYLRKRTCKFCENNIVPICDVYDLFKNRDYTLIDIYQFDKLLKYRCPNGHQKAMKLDSFISGSQCPKCYKYKQ